MKKSKPLGFYFLFVFMVFVFWVMIGIITVLIDEVIGIKPGNLILGFLALFAIKLSWMLSLKLTLKE